MIEIVRITEADWERWAALRLRALRDAPEAFGSRYADWVDAPEARWRDRLRLPGGVNFVAVLPSGATGASLDGPEWVGPEGASLDGPEWVGMASGVPGVRENERDLISMWVAPEVRGAGVADALIEAVREWCGGAELWLSVVRSNARAQSVYARHGFVAVEDCAGGSAGAAGDDCDDELRMRLAR
ncbi:GNAT family N-acetyltransferase [Micrococcales bacterium 31B]|nr:GNAT family N-acetyltransferase [Micrococcales bacterium 31B]